MILDKLIEKKDMLNYINLKIEFLDDWLKHIKDIRRKDRAFVVERIKGRKRELQKLKTLIHNDKLKEQSKQLWRTLNKKGDI